MRCTKLGPAIIDTVILVWMNTSSTGCVYTVVSLNAHMKGATSHWLKMIVKNSCRPNCLRLLRNAWKRRKFQIPRNCTAPIQAARPWWLQNGALKIRLPLPRYQQNATIAADYFVLSVGFLGTWACHVRSIVLSSAVQMQRCTCLRRRTNGGSVLSANTWLNALKVASAWFAGIVFTVYVKGFVSL